VDGAAGNSIKTFIIVLVSSWLLFLPGAGGEGMEPGAATLGDRENALQLQAALDEEEKQLIIELLNWDVKIEAARLEQERLQREIPLQEELLAASEVQLAQSRAVLEEGRDRLGRGLTTCTDTGALSYLAWSRVLRIFK
jgi:hypothetical protein